MPLTCHPDTPSRAVTAIELQLAMLASGRLRTRFHVDGVLDDIALPDPAPPERADGLWRTTCFELFVHDQAGSGYIEFNFSPSSRWSAYRFSDYREFETELGCAQPPKIELDASETHLTLEVELDIPRNAGKLALSAVIEESDGTKSYWALAHPLGKPDFHHKDCFALTLPAPGTP